MISDDLESACIYVIGVVLFSRAASSPLVSHLTLGDRPCISSLGSMDEFVRYSRTIGLYCFASISVESGRTGYIASQRLFPSLEPSSVTSAQNVPLPVPRALLSNITQNMVAPGHDFLKEGQDFEPMTVLLHPAPANLTSAC